MKKIGLFILFIGPSLVANSQSLDGKGKTETVKPEEIHHSAFAIERDQYKYLQEDLPKYKRDKPVRFYQWFDYKENDTLKRYRREYDVEYFMYDEWFTSQRNPGKYKSPRHFGKRLGFEFMNQRGHWFVAHGGAKVYQDGVLQATVIFDHGRPTQILVNHYYENGQLHFVRDIRSEGKGRAFKNVGVLEYYRPDGAVFENPLTEDGSAIIILNDLGEPEDECACMDQDIMEWGMGYLYPFLGKFYFLLEEIYRLEKMECCWE